MSHDHPVHLCYSLLVEGLFRYNAHFIITPFSLGSHDEHYNEVAGYLTPFPSYRGILVKLSLLTGMPTFNSLIRGELLNSSCEIWPQEIRNITLITLSCGAQHILYIEPFRHGSPV